jgi:hypothetical protein
MVGEEGCGADPPEVALQQRGLDVHEVDQHQPTEHVAKIVGPRWTR